MYLYCVETLSSFQSNLDLKKKLKLLQNLANDTTIVQGLQPNFIKNH